MMAHQAMDWITARNRKEKLIEMMKAGNWRGVLAEFTEDFCYREPLLVWIKPSLGCLQFIAAELGRLGLDNLSSVGCGCGTLLRKLTAAPQAERGNGQHRRKQQRPVRRRRGRGCVT